jgi:hypothetical protein
MSVFDNKYDYQIDHAGVNSRRSGSDRYTASRPQTGDAAVPSHNSRRDAITATWTLEQFADHYAYLLSKPSNALGLHSSNIYGDSRLVAVDAAVRFGREAQ